MASYNEIFGILTIVFESELARTSAPWPTQIKAPPTPDKNEKI